MKKYFLLPGQYYVTKDPCLITTILGSCVAIAIVDSESKIAGLNHYLLPNSPNISENTPRYGSYAIPTLIKSMESRGANRSTMKAKIFGGAKVLENFSIGTAIGEKNIDLAIRTLNELQIPIIQKDVGGSSGRRLLFDTQNFQTQCFIKEGSDQKESNVSGRITVGIVDDSPTIRSLFSKIFTKNNIEVVGVSADVYEAREMILNKNPMVITLDITMPQMSGVDFLKKLMTYYPLPVVMVSTLNSQAKESLQCLESGAVEFLEKPSRFDPSALTRFGQLLTQKVKAAALTNKSRIKVQYEDYQSTIIDSTSNPKKASTTELILIGGNTGAHKDLKTLLKTITPDSPPILVINSTIVGFLETFINEIQPLCKSKLLIAQDNECLKSGTIYFAPPQKHLYLDKKNDGITIHLKDGGPVYQQIPSLSVSFESAVHLKINVSALIMSGYGEDGLSGIEKIYNSGGLILVQNPSECACPYLPEKTISLGLSHQVGTLHELCSELKQLMKRKAA